ncbi:MAG: hypothetical protein WC455_22620 [Dehalococcoidia bacterium]|jgi:hypothetical protein
MDIINMEQASSKVIALENGKLKLSGGNAVEVGRIVWLSFEDMWKRLTKIIADVQNLQTLAADVQACVELSISAGKTMGSESSNESQMQATMTARYQAFRQLMADMEDAPAVISMMIEKTCMIDGKYMDADEVRALPVLDVLKLFIASVQVNFFADDAKELLGFFVGTIASGVSMLGGSDGELKDS